MHRDTDLAIPILPCRSVSATTEFYRRLGFEGGAHAFDQNYAIFKRGPIELHFFAHPRLVAAESWAGCYIRVSDVQTLYEAGLAMGLPDSGIPRIDPLEDKPWGLKEFAVVDPDGNLLRIGQIIQHD
jgi:catechol 2,3-dioxygenase-like lactoylglutathione lyase family enzyme